MQQLSLVSDLNLPLEVLAGWCWGDQTLLFWTPKDSSSLEENNFTLYEITTNKDK